MRNFTFLFATICYISAVSAKAQLQSPAQFLGYELGAQFSRHHQVVDYFEHLAAESEAITLEPYGKTYENRSLNLAYISTKENMAQIEQIREDNLIRAGLKDGTPTTQVVIVWLSYNVHGNESVSTEAAMGTAYDLLTNPKSNEWLKNTLVIMDPCINPDGRERYVNFYYQKGNQPYNPNPDSWEHHEPWPGGRANHYLFDLNRDWAWQSQVESQQRLKVYNQWLPQIHVDFHEMGLNNPYYFAPAAKPFHEQVSNWQREFQTEIGKNHAKYFDKNSWLYFTKQVYDLLYPSYGDTYPTFNGAIGMTYEQGGSGRAGLGILNEVGDTLTLVDRIAHHTISGLSTVEATAVNAEQVLSQFEAFFSNPKATQYNSYVLKHDGNESKFNDLMTWLDAQGIEYGNANFSKSLSGYAFDTGRKASFNVSSEDLVISTKQPKSVMVTVLFEPKTKLEDSLTYDITAWSVPYAFGIEAFATSTSLATTSVKKEEPTIQEVKEAYGYIFQWKSMKDAKLLANLLENDLKVRFTTKAIELVSGRYERGSFTVTKADNSRVDLRSIVMKCARDLNMPVDELPSGLSLDGPDIGSSDLHLITAPKVALIGGEGTSSLQYGAIWHYFEQELGYPVTTISTDYFSSVDLSVYDVIIMPNGSYGGFSGTSRILDWVEDGGKLIAVQGAVAELMQSDRTSLKYFADDQIVASDIRNAERDEAYQLLPKEEQERFDVMSSVTGAVFKVKMDNSDPLAFGYGTDYYTLKTTEDRYAYLNEGNVGTIRSAKDHLSGFAGTFLKEDIEGSLVFGVESMRRGDVVYMIDDPLFRSFWYGGELLFANAIFFVGK